MRAEAVADVLVLGSNLRMLLCRAFNVTESVKKMREMLRTQA